MGILTPNMSISEKLPGICKTNRSRNSSERKQPPKHGDPLPPDTIGGHMFICDRTNERCIGINSAERSVLSPTKRSSDSIPKGASYVATAYCSP
jgi:hypothetical protein